MRAQPDRAQAGVDPSARAHNITMRTPERTTAVQNERSKPPETYPDLPHACEFRTLLQQVFHLAKLRLGLSTCTDRSNGVAVMLVMYALPNFVID
jgi:hypothetical protein